MARAAIAICGGFVLTCASVLIQPASDERTMYGFEGNLEQNWRVREVAGWPAPYLADSPDTSVPHKIGIEDTFRPGPFVADLGFWILLTLSGMRAVASRRARGSTRA
jgi:hypothetical protein